MRTPKPPRNFWFARAVRATVGNIAIAVFRVKLVGREKLPTGGGFVLAGNHISYADPVLLWCRSPRPVHFMARENLWDSDFLGWALDWFWAFPVKRDAADREALQRASAYLKAGEPVGIFPEGTRKFKGNNEAHGGAAFLAIRNEVPVFPIGISGTDRIKPPGARMLRFPKVVMAVGDPIDPASFAQGGRKERVEAMTGEVMRRIEEQVAEAQEVAGR
jgi:1-acyl-sn-glycerol-3-phosphate acyltransferase